MSIDIQTLIAQKPHLKDPLELYDRWLRFREAASSLLPKNGSTPSPDAKAYTRESAGPLIKAFASVFGLPADALAPLGRAMEAGDVDLSRLPLDEVPAFSLPYAEEELATTLFLLGRPYFLKLGDACSQDGGAWENGRCPVCSAKPALASIMDGPRRVLHCSWCGTAGSCGFRNCPVCGNNDASKLGTLVPEEERGFRVVTCSECSSYVKIVEEGVLARLTPDLADLASLPLDFVAQGRGFARRAPNPIGLKRVG